MAFSDPLKNPKEHYQRTIDLIKSEGSAVGIDAQYTHAIVIEFLTQISKRIERIESHLKIPV